MCSTRVLVPMRVSMREGLPEGWKLRSLKCMHAWMMMWLTHSLAHASTCMHASKHDRHTCAVQTCIDAHATHWHMNPSRSMTLRLLHATRLAKSCMHVHGGRAGFVKHRVLASASMQMCVSKKAGVEMIARMLMYASACMVDCMLLATHRLCNRATS